MPPAPRARAPRRLRPEPPRTAPDASSSARRPAVTLDSGETTALLDQLDALEQSRKDGRLILPDGDTLEVTNLHKVFWPEIGKTKGDLLRHYARVAPLILPVIKDRPLVMKRLPNGVTGKAFYQHRAPEPVPPGVRAETLPDDDVPARLVGGSLKTLLYMAQIASISMDPFFSTMQALDHADQVAIDLDPQPGATFAQILDVARWVHEILDARQRPGLSEDLRLRGAAHLHSAAARHAVRGGHAVLPDRRDDGGDRAPEGGDGAADGEPAARTAPSTSTTCRTSRARRWRAPTARGRARLPGSRRRSTWQELDEGPTPQDFTIDTIAARVDAVGDLWADLRADKGANLLAAIDKLS